MYLNMSNDELSKKFEEFLLETNRDYRYYIDWNNINCLEPYSIEIHAMDVLIHCKESDFKQRFSDLITKLPSVIEVFPFLFALDKKSRKEVVKDGNLKICSEIGSLDYGIFNFNRNNLIGECSDAQIDKYYDFFVNMGLKDLFQNLLEKSVEDYIIGILVGLDSNGRKNRGGKAFEFACEPIITQICNKYNLDILKQKKFNYLVKYYNMNVNKDIENRKADFIIINKSGTKCMNIEVNFYNGGGSKPEEIIDAYISRQNDLSRIGIKFALITDGNCWRGTTNQLKKGFNNFKYLMNYSLSKNGMLEEIIKAEFGD